ncbi:hypothetical protein HYDPIDRAFT_118612 [Hydnomerulius pinastri MD-312]|uniref:F-box domain-containing protein n=1 Tax=Hydnomerulius pinastri MD-312 TaxID=994086 RepID=A0A0C9W0I2_9AGAM|nr:hypothetical protein HYDPIDRAFT_118612 [Hydnomerulius pinastri MD-312]
MNRIKDVHQRLTDKRGQIAASMETHQGLIACIRRLPSEILGEIFMHCLPPDAHNEPNPNTAPLLLTRICRPWRKVALSTPRLWCSLSVRPSHRVQQQGLFYYHTWLSRARGCPLSLAVDTRLVHAPRNPVWRYEVTELLQPYTSRCSRLLVTFDEATAPELLLKDIPVLEHLTLEGDMKYAQKIFITQPQPHLRSLTLHSFPFSPDLLSLFNPAWANLTQVKVVLGRGGDVDGHVFLSLLQLCPNLEGLVFNPICIGRSEVSVHPPGTLLHANLRSLDVIVLYGLNSLLNILTLPKLRDLSISDLVLVPGPWPHKEFKSFLSRSHCPLASLKIYGAQVSMKKEHRAEYVTLIPTLKHVGLGRGVVMNV